MISEAETDASLAQTEDFLAEQTRPNPLTMSRADEVLPRILSSQRRPVHQLGILMTQCLCARGNRGSKTSGGVSVQQHPSRGYRSCAIVLDDARDTQLLASIHRAGC